MCHIVSGGSDFRASEDMDFNPIPITGQPHTQHWNGASSSWDPEQQPELGVVTSNAYQMHASLHSMGTSVGLIESGGPET